MKTNIDFVSALGSFFSLRDWKARSFYLGIYLIITSIPLLVSYFFFSILISTEIPALIIIGLTFLSFGFFTYCFAYFYVLGYRIDVARAFRDDEDIEKVHVFYEAMRRMKEGKKLFFTMAIYYLPVICLSVLGYILFLIPGIFGPNLQILFYIGGMLLLMIGFFLYLFVYYLIYPIVGAKIVNKAKFSDLLDFVNSWKHIKNNWKNLIYINIGIYLSNLLMSTALIIGFLSIFLCLGIILFPIIWVVGNVYIHHVHAELIGNFAKNLNYNG